MKKLPTAAELMARHPLTDSARARVRRDRAEVSAILDGSDPRLLFVVGPCSAWPEEAVFEYAQRLKELEPLVQDQLKLVLRTYVQKPRTSRGWTGPINQPDPFLAPDLEAGMDYCRSMMVRIVELGLPIADEALFTHNSRGFLELLSWVAIGARSSEDPEHRIWASAFDAPVGLKNPTSGCIGVGSNSVLAAQSPHVAMFDGYQVETSGNPYAHLVLRGGVEGPNYHLNDLYLARRCLKDRGVVNPAVVIDASHDNSRIDGRKDPEAQEDVVREILANLRVRSDLRNFVRGFLLESFLKGGSQNLESLRSETVDRGGLSITDGCLSWERTEVLILDVADELRQREAAPLRRSA